MVTENRALVNGVFVNMFFLVLPSLYHISKENDFDSNLGRLSLPIYLLHFAVYFFMVRLCARVDLVNELIIALFAVLSTCLAAFLLDQFLIRKFDQIRYRWSGKLSAAVQKNGSAVKRIA
jgi:peptidoglycan/LPS O-acetylase OafA/YrhL